MTEYDEAYIERVVSPRVKEIIARRAEAEQLPLPTTVSLWLSWLINSALHHVYEGVANQDASAFFEASRLIGTCAFISKRGGERSTKVPAFPDFLFLPPLRLTEPPTLSSSVENKALAIIDTLCTEQSLYEHARLRAEHEEVMIFPKNVAGWVAWFINDGCLMTYNGAASHEDRPSRFPDGTLLTMASEEFQCVSSLYRLGARPSLDLPIFPHLEKG